LNPYKALPPECFWRTGVASQHPTTIERLYRKKFSITPQDRISTAGSCFAQHVANYLKRRGGNIVDVEPPPPGLSPRDARAYGYLTYSARFGNIYTIRSLLQLLDDAKSGTVRDADIWESEGRFYDGLRPAVEPKGLNSREEVREHRIKHLSHVLSMFHKTDVFVFTLGLTEAWLNSESGTTYPMCPGTIAGKFDAKIHKFHNFGFSEILADLRHIRSELKSLGPDMRFLLTVSPVPLTATASGKHVLVATTHSKSILRAVCGAISEEFPDVDYFPSYELITSPMSRGFFFESNLRSVTDAGVEAVMRVFFSEHSFKRAAPSPAPDPSVDIVCEERLLEAFA
jgi:hypothetical protein